MKTPLRSMLPVLVLAAGAALAADQPALKPLVSIEIPKSKGKFDFLRIDSKRHRLLAAHENDGTADFFDLDKKALITRLRVGGAVDTAVDANSDFYYVSVQESERVAVLDAATLKEIKSIKMPGPTDAIIYVAKNHRVYTTHDNGAEVWVIDPATATVSATIAVPGVPEYMVYDESADRIYLNIKSKDVVAVIDPVSNSVVAQWSTAPALQPHGLALQPSTHRIFSAGGNGKLVAIDTRTGAVSANVNIAAKVDQIAFDPAADLIYCAGAGKLTVIHADKQGLSSLGDLETAETAKNVAVDPATRNVWTTYTDGHNSYARAWSPPAL